MDDELKTLVESHGDRVAMHTVPCGLWRETHIKDCQGCRFELGCGKYQALHLLRQRRAASEGNVRRILAATTSPEIVALLESIRRPARHGGHDDGPNHHPAA